LGGIIIFPGATCGRVIMTKAYFKVQKQFCGECSLALRRFIGGMDGVITVDVENGAVAVDFDERKIPEERVQKLTRDSIEKLGYRVEDE
jgi:copper chaperone CopZ